MDLGTACAHTHHSTRSGVVASRIDTQTNRPIPHKEQLPNKDRLPYKGKHTDKTSGSTEQCRAPTPSQRSQGGAGTPSTHPTTHPTTHPPHPLPHSSVSQCIQWPTSGVSAGQIMPQCVLCSWRGRASLPSLPMGELRRRRWERVDVKVRRFSTWGGRGGEGRGREER